VQKRVDSIPRLGVEGRYEIRNWFGSSGRIPTDLTVYNDDHYVLDAIFYQEKDEDFREIQTKKKQLEIGSYKHGGT